MLPELSSSSFLTASRPLLLQAKSQLSPFSTFDFKDAVSRYPRALSASSRLRTKQQ